MDYYKINDVDFTKLAFSKTKKSSGLRFIKAFINKKNLGLKLPTFRIPFNSKVNNFGNLELNLSIDKEEVIKKFKELDELMMEYAKTNAWFEDSQESELEFSPSLRENGDFQPLFKIKIPVKDEEVQTIFYDNKNTIINVDTQEQAIEYLTKNTKVQTGIDCVGVWINGNKFGLSWKAHQIKIISSPQPEDEEGVFETDSEASSEDGDVKLLIDHDE